MRTASTSRRQCFTDSCSKVLTPWALATSGDRLHQAWRTGVATGTCRVRVSRRISRGTPRGRYQQGNKKEVRGSQVAHARFDKFGKRLPDTGRGCGCQLCAVSNAPRYERRKTLRVDQLWSP